MLFRSMQDEHSGFDAGTHYLGRYTPDKALLIQLMIRDELLRLKEIEVTSFDFSALEQWSVQMQQKSLTDIEIDSSEILMTVNSGENEKLVTTIPYDKGWHVQVDGEKAEARAFKNTFIEIPLEPGNHEIRLKFIPRGYPAGLVASLCGVTGLAVIELLKKKLSVNL